MQKDTTYITFYFIRRELGTAYTTIPLQPPSNDLLAQAMHLSGIDNSYAAIDETTAATASPSFVINESALRGCVKHYRCLRMSVDPTVLLNELRPEMAQILSNELSARNTGVIFSIIVSIELRRLNQYDVEELTTIPVRSKNANVYADDDIDSELLAASDKISSTIEELELRGSGWQIVQTKFVDLTIVRYNPLSGGADNFVRLPPDLENKSRRSLINVRPSKTEPNSCFKYAVLASLHSNDILDGDVANPDSYDMFESRYTFPSSQPVRVSGRPLIVFEQRNSLSVNIYGHENGQIFPLRISKRRITDEPLISLLLVMNDDNLPHYVAIMSMGGLLMGQRHGGYYVCPWCLHSFSANDTFQRHQADCSQFFPQRVSYPEPGSTIQFENVQRAERIGFVAYADLECSLKHPNADGGDTISHTVTRQQYHEVYSAAAYMIGNDGDTERFREPTRKRFIKRHTTTAQPDDIGVLEAFFNTMFDWAAFAFKEGQKKMVWTDADQVNFDCTTVCCVCNQPFEEGDVTVRDHSHTDGRYFLLLLLHF
jgi:hypothetical protein